MSAPMQRRDFLRKMGLVAAGVVAADQLDLLDRLGWTRKFFPSGELAPVYPSLTERDLEQAMREVWQATYGIPPSIYHRYRMDGRLLANRRLVSEVYGRVYEGDFGQVS